MQQSTLFVRLAPVFFTIASMFCGTDATLGDRIRIDLPTEFARLIVIPSMPTFNDTYPDVELEISSTDTRVDLVQEGMDCVLRIGGIFDETLVARRLGTLRMVNAANPACLVRHGVPHTLQDLLVQRYRTVHYTPALGTRPFSWEYPEGDGYAVLLPPGSVSVNNVQTYHSAGLAWLRLIQAGLPSLAQFLKSGELVEILRDLRPEPLPVSIVVAHRHNLSRHVRFFIDWLEQTLQPYLDH